MTQEWTMDELQDTLVRLYQRAASDPAFRKQCVTDPDAAIEQIAGKPPQEKGKVRFTDDASSASRSADAVVLALPGKDKGPTAAQVREDLFFDWPWTSFSKTCRHHPCSSPTQTKP